MTGTRRATGVKHARMAADLGVGHTGLPLCRHGSKAWSYADEPPGRVEAAALRHFQAAGWEGADSEGGLILSLIKAASFEQISDRDRRAVIECLYAQHWETPFYRVEDLLNGIRASDPARIERNSNILHWWPRLRREQLPALFAALGRNRLLEIAEIFARAPYDYRAGWPDLTLWRGTEVRLIEVKAPGDGMHESQTRLCRDILVPLGIDVVIADVIPVAPASTAHLRDMAAG